MEEQCAILVCSCDKYEEAWKPFFALLRKYWTNCTYPIYLLTERKKCDIKDVKTICCTDEYWSNRLLYALNNIRSQYVLLLLDDFFIQSSCNSSEIACCLRRMDDDDSIGVFYYKKITGHNAKSNYEGYNDIDWGKKYAFCFQAALWRKSFLIECITPNKDPWDIEENGLLHRFPQKKGYCWNIGTYTDCSKDVIPYLWALESGYGICKSRWLWNNKKFFKTEDIDCRCNTLPTFSKFQYYFPYLLEKVKKRIERMKGSISGGK